MTKVVQGLFIENVFDGNSIDLELLRFLLANQIVDRLRTKTSVVLAPRNFCPQ